MTDLAYLPVTNGQHIPNHRRKNRTPVRPSNPYRDWLGIDVSVAPASPHRLLGIAPWERNPRVIEEAALTRVAQVRKYQLAFPEESGRLLNEIARAMTVLLDAAQAA